MKKRKLFPHKNRKAVPRLPAGADRRAAENERRLAEELVRRQSAPPLDPPNPGDQGRPTTGLVVPVSTRIEAFTYPVPDGALVERIGEPPAHAVLTSVEGKAQVVVNLALDEPRPLPPPSPPIDVPAHDPDRPLPDTLLKELETRGLSVSWVPPALLYKGRLVANLPRGAFRELKGYEIMELIRVINDRGTNDILQADEVERLLGWQKAATR